MFTGMVEAGIRSVLRAACIGAIALGAAALACGGAEPGDGLPLLTITECQDLGGAPLFDPEDQRPLQESCPDGTYFVGEFDEEFYGGDGGICCAGPDQSIDSSDSP
jgi:hypothetical protein